MLDNTILWINCYLVNSAVHFVNSYPLDSDLSVGFKHMWQSLLGIWLKIFFSCVSVLCGPGEFLSSNILCSPCPVGTYSLGTALNKSMLQCTSCPAGTYSSKTRSMQCTRCAKGTFASKTGSSSCTKCKNDFFTSKPGQSSCSSARIGFIVFTVFVSLLIAGPLLILILQKRSRDEKCSLCIPRSPSRQRLREDKQPNIYVIQNE